MQRLISFLKCESGAQAVEYAMIGGAAAVTITWAMQSYDKEIKAMYGHVQETVANWGTLF